MKKHLLRIVVLACLAVCSGIFSFGKSVSVTLVPFPLPSIDDDDRNPFGHRTPSRPLAGIIDFDSNEVILSGQVEEIESYEIWNEDLTTLLYSGCDEIEFIRTLSEIDENVMIVLHTSSYILKGHLNP